MHGRSRMTMDPRIPTMPGRSASGFHPPGRHLPHKDMDTWEAYPNREHMNTSSHHGHIDMHPNHGHIPKSRTHTQTMDTYPNYGNMTDPNHGYIDSLNLYQLHMETYTNQGHTRKIRDT
ncbi:unnamed protein product [Laminaria digitata]